MRKRLTLLLILAVLGAALMLPSTAAAATGFSYKVIYNYCDGANPKFKVKNIAEGTTATNRLTNETWVERRSGSGGPWSVVYSWTTASYTFTPNNKAHWLTSWRTWTGDQTHWYRIGFRVKAFHNKSLLSSTVLYSKKC